jgi:hypothetical protein
VNIVLAQFAKVLSVVKYKLFKASAMAVYMVYGSCLWDFESKVMDDFSVNWRKSVRRVWGLPYRTHCALLNLICDDLPVETQLHIRFLKFIHGVLSSDNECVNMCGQTSLNGSASDASNTSINFICCMYGLSKYEAFKESTGYLVNHVTSRVAATDDNICSVRRLSRS